MRSCSDADWRSLAAESPQGSPFVDTWFLDQLEHEREFLVVTDADAPIAGLPLLLDRGEPVEQPLPLTMYQGPILAGEVAAMPPHRRLPVVIKALTALIESLSERFRRFSFSCHHALEDLRALSWFNYYTPERGQFLLQPRYTGLLSLSDLADKRHWLRSIRTSRRQDIDKARYKGLECLLTDDLDTLCKLYVATFQRQNIVVEPQIIKLVRAIAEAALQQSRGFVAECRRSNGDVLAANLIVHDDDCAFYLVGANDPAGRPLGAASLLMFDCLTRCRDIGLATFDFVGINSPQRGDFKSSFNAEPKLYFDAILMQPGPRAC